MESPQTGGPFVQRPLKKRETHFKRSAHKDFAGWRGLVGR